MHGRRNGVYMSQSTVVSVTVPGYAELYQRYEAYLTAVLSEREGVFFDEMDLFPSLLFGPFMSVIADTNKKVVEICGYGQDDEEIPVRLL